ncbi:MAG TPA: tetratricopeptide repeat protein, partial [Bacteroidia bacterium]|nr:tetratricopeptide repeat protein [Bacteroidia bacterium]
LVNVHPDEPQAHALYGDLLFGDGQIAKAAQQYQRTLELNDNNYKVWQQLLACFEQLGDFTKLDKESDKALELFPNRLIFYYYNATAAFQQGNHKKAAATAEAGVDLGVNDKQVNVSLYNIIGSAYYKQAKYNESYAAFEEALTLDPNNLLVLNNYAYYLSEQGDHLEKALAMSKRTIEISPNNPAYLDTYGWILYKSERYNDALGYIRKALELSPGDGDIMEHLGDVHYRLGNKEEAAKYWQKSKDSGNDSVQLDRKINEGKLSD